MNSHGVLLTIGGITLAKWRPSLPNAAPTQTITISSFAATIMSTKGKRAKNSSAGRYCSLRAARKKTLSRRPRITISATIGSTAAGASRPSSALGTRIAVTMLASTPAYSATSSAVRSSPLVNGTLPGHGGRRIVRGRP